MQTLTLDLALTDFLTALRARNASALTAQAYATDIRQFILWLQETTVLDLQVGTVSKTDIIEYLSYLADLGRSGITRARKLASIRPNVGDTLNTASPICDESSGAMYCDVPRRMKLFSVPSPP